MTDLCALIEAVEAGTERPEDIAKAFGVRPWNAYPYHKALASLDAAVALANKVLPGWNWAIDAWGDATVCHPDGAKHGLYEAGIPDNPARALLLAALRAKLEGE